MRISNVAWTFFGLSVPLLFAFFTIPELIALLGIERFGLLSLAWGLIGVAGLFDLGIGRATTQTISRLRGLDQLEETPAVVSTGVRLAFRIGLCAAFLLGLAVLAGAVTHVRFSEGLVAEAEIAAYLVAAAIPIQSTSAVFRGVNEGFENFQAISLIRIALGAANFVGPYCVATMTSDLGLIVAALFGARLLALLLFRSSAKACLKRNVSDKATTPIGGLSRAVARQLMSFGGWFTVSSIISPVLVQADRFFIGVLISAAAVATYTIPYEVVTQTLVIVGAISSVAFPSLSALVHARPETSKAVFRTWLLRTSVTMLLITTLGAVLLPVFLPWWIGPQLPSESVLIGQILLLGVFFNSIASMYFALLHAYGRTDVTAKVHLLELPLFLTALYVLVTQFGVLGAAFAWAGRMLIDALLLWAAQRLCLTPLRPLKAQQC